MLKIISILNVKKCLTNSRKNYSLTTPNIETKIELTKVTQKKGIREIQLNDPKTRNSLSLKMMETLINDIKKDKENPELRCIVLSSVGNVFSAGHNLKELIPEKGSENHHFIFTKCTELMMSIIKSPVPVIAKVDGIAAAAGCQLIATCDMVVCSDKSAFSTPGAHFGIFCSTPGIALARTINRMKATQMLFTGQPITANDALIAGLVSSVVSKEQLDSKVDQICHHICTQSRHVIELGKQFFYQQISMDIKTAYEYGSDVMTQNLTLDDGIEGIRSFIEKRKPKWT